MFCWTLIWFRPNWLGMKLPIQFFFSNFSFSKTVIRLDRFHVDDYCLLPGSIPHPMGNLVWLPNAWGTGLSNFGWHFIIIFCCVVGNTVDQTRLESIALRLAKKCNKHSCSIGPLNHMRKHKPICYPAIKKFIQHFRCIKISINWTN